MNGVNRRVIAAVFVCALATGALCAGRSSAESVFDAGRLPVGAPPGFPVVGTETAFGAAAGIALASSQDTMEMFDVQLEPQKKGMSIYKEVAIVAVVSAAAGFAVYQMIHSDDTAEPSDGGGSGKPTPFVAPYARFSFSR